MFVIGTKTLSAAQLQIYRQQQVLRQQQQLRVLQSRSGATATAAQKVSVAVTSSTPQRVQQVSFRIQITTNSELSTIIKKKINIPLKKIYNETLYGIYIFLLRNPPIYTIINI